MSNALAFSAYRSLLQVAGAGSRPSPRDATVEQLIEWYVGGDGAAFEELYSRVSPRLFGYLMRLAADRTKSEDLLQIRIRAMPHGFDRGAR